MTSSWQLQRRQPRPTWHFDAGRGVVHYIQQQRCKAVARMSRAARKCIFERLDLPRGCQVRLQRRSECRQCACLLLLLLCLRPMGELQSQRLL